MSFTKTNEKPGNLNQIRPNLKKSTGLFKQNACFISPESNWCLKGVLLKIFNCGTARLNFISNRNVWINPPEVNLHQFGCCSDFNTIQLESKIKEFLCWMRVIFMHISSTKISEYYVLFYWSASLGAPNNPHFSFLLYFYLFIYLNGLQLKENPCAFILRIFFLWYLKTVAEISSDVDV